VSLPGSDSTDHAADIAGSLTANPQLRPTRAPPWRGASAGDEIGVVPSRGTPPALGAEGEPEAQTGVGGLQASWIVHKNTVMAAVRIPDGKGGRCQTVRECSTFTGELLRLRDWLVAQGVTQVVMEATGVCWKPPGSSPRM